MSLFLRVEELVKEFPSQGRAPSESMAAGSPSSEVGRALDGVSFEVRRRESLGICGPSGSGKTTLVLCLLRLIRPTSGTIRVDGRDLWSLNRRDLRAYRRRVGVVFQDPYASLNPRMKVSEILREPLEIHGLGSRRDQLRRVDELLEWVGLGIGQAHRKPVEFSGGERQRIAIARALASRPEVLIADEPVSSLDGPVRGRITQLLHHLRRELGFTLILISHGLRLIAMLCERVAVMGEGRIVESGDVGKVFAEPGHPLTRLLLETDGLLTGGSSNPFSNG